MSKVKHMNIRYYINDDWTIYDHIYFCISVYCTDPPIIPNARHNGAESQARFEVNHTLQYTCVQGYITKGFSVSRCLLYNGTMQWFGPEMDCERKRRTFLIIQLHESIWNYSYYKN